MTGTYLVVLDREEDEPVGVLLKQGLVGLLGLDAGGDGGLGLLDLLRLGDRRDVLRDSGAVGVVLLVGRAEVELLHGRLHLERVDGGSSLFDCELGDKLHGCVRTRVEQRG